MVFQQHSMRVYHIIKYTLNKEEKEIIKREEKYWWLTGFEVGMFSKSKQLSLEIQIIFLNWKMQRAFIIMLGYAGYTTNDITTDSKKQ